MFRILKTLACLWLVFAGSTAHAALEDEALVLLEDRDFAALEALLNDAHAQALAARSFKAAGKVVDITFSNATDARFEAVLAWRDAYPDSAYANVAVAKISVIRAQQLRGPYALGHTSYEGQEAFYAYMEEAYHSLEHAMAVDPSNLPAIHGAIEVRLAVGDKSQIYDLTQRGLEIAPAPSLIRRAVQSLQLNWGGGHDAILSEIRDICGSLTAGVDELDPESCMIDFVFGNRMQGPMRATALKALESNTNPQLDWVRSKAYIFDWQKRPGAVKKAIAYHRKTLKSLSLTAFKDDLLWLRANYVKQHPKMVETYFAEAQAAMIEEARRRIEMTPWNIGTRVVLIEHLISENYIDPSEDVIAEVKGHWVAASQLGLYRFDVWELGAKVAFWADQSDDPDTLFAMHGNMIYFGNYRPDRIQTALWDLINKYNDLKYKPGGPNPPLAMVCPMVRMARIYEAVCAQMPDHENCSEPSFTIDKPPHVTIYAMAKEHRMCEAERKAKIEDLVFDPVALPAWSRSGS